MTNHFLFLFFILILFFGISETYATELTAILLGTGQASVNNDQIILDDTSSLDLADGTVNVTPFSETIGSISVDLSQQVQLVSNTVDNPITLQNTELSSVLVTIPDQTKISGSSTWDNTITPPKIISTSGIVPSGFVTPTSSIQIGSSSEVLIFNLPVTILLNGLTDQIGYKLPNNNNWILISTCLGTFSNPTPPLFPNECSITNGIDTKIVTFHFTEFGGLDVIVPKRSGGGSSGDRTPPALQSNSLSSPDSNIFGGTLKLDDSARNSASLFETGDTIDLELSFYENTGIDSLQHVTLFTNVQGFEDRYDSDLYVEWNKGKPLKVYDPERYLDDSTIVSFEERDANIIMTFHLNFVKPMGVSHIILYYWDFSRNSGIVEFNDALKIFKAVDVVMPQSQTKEQRDTRPTRNDAPVSTKTENIFPDWLKYDLVGWWISHSISDEEFSNAINYLLDKKIIDVDVTEYNGKITHNIPVNVKNMFSEWNSNNLNDDSIIQVIKIYRDVGTW